MVLEDKMIERLKEIRNILENEREYYNGTTKEKLEFEKEILEYYLVEG